MEVFKWSVGDGPRGNATFCCAIGNFDGVHVGHQYMLERARNKAHTSGMSFGVVTFNPHPHLFFSPDAPPFLLTDSAMKYKKLADAGVEHILEVKFDEALRQLSPDAFTRDVLATSLNVRHLFAGADFCFGKGRSGSLSDLAEIGKTCQLMVTPTDLYLDDKDKVVSSSRIRDALRDGNIRLATQMLGGSPVISGIVEMGDQRGRLLSFPTANIQMGKLLQPALGVYAVVASIQGEDGEYQGVCNIGRRPTVNDRGVLAETHLFAFDRDIYGKVLNVRLKGFLRCEQKFDGLDALQSQIARDAEAARVMLDILPIETA